MRKNIILVPKGRLFKEIAEIHPILKELEGTRKYSIEDDENRYFVVSLSDIYEQYLIILENKNQKNFAYISSDTLYELYYKSVKENSRFICNYETIKSLDCSFALLKHKDYASTNPHVIYTPYPYTARHLFSNIAVYQLKSTEWITAFNKSAFIFDHYETGDTAKENDLIVLPDNRIVGEHRLLLLKSF